MNSGWISAKLDTSMGGSVTKNSFPSIPFRLQPFNMSRQPIQTRKQGEAIDTILIESFLQTRANGSGNHNLIHIGRLELLIGVGMDGEQSTLSCDSLDQMSWNELADLAVFERIRMLIDRDIRIVMIGIDD